MATEKFVNSPTPSTPSTAWATITAGINASVTALALSTLSPFPDTVQFRVLIDDELMLVTALPGGLAATVTRGVEGTSAASHASGASVYHVLSAAALARSPGSMTTVGDLEYLDANGAPARLGIGSVGQVFTVAGGLPSWASPVSGGVTSVAMTVPSILSVAGSPITSSGTLAVSLATQSANLIFGGPATGSAAAPTFRVLVAADIPDISATYLTPSNSAALTNKTGAISQWTNDASYTTLAAVASVGYLTSVTAHNLLSATHGDTLTDTVVRGDLLYGNATPKWARLPKPSVLSGLSHDGTDVSWVTATGTGAPVRATSATLVTPTISGTTFFPLTPRFNAAGSLSTAGNDTIAFFYMPYGGFHGDPWDNLFIGYLAGAAWDPASTAYSNVAIGPQAGRALNGNGNAPIGNVFVGHSAGEAVTTGSGNTLLGDAAGNALITQNNLTYVGFHAGVSSTGASNTVVGASSLSGTSNSGGANSILGAASATANSLSGSRNSIVGAEAMRALTSGSQNSAIGWNSLDGVTTGGNNIGIGEEAGNNITTGANNIVIGAAKTVPSGTASNQLNIGGFLVGNISPGALGLGIAPTAVLHLKGGTATASTAPLKFASGANLTTAEAGAMEYNGTNLFFTRAGTTREGVLTQSAVATEVLVSDTSITVNIGGTTYKLLARA